MNTPVKILLGIVGAAGVGYGAYRIYKWWKEEDALEAEGLTYEELVEQAEAKKTEEKLAAQVEREEEFAEHIREIDGLPNDGLDWYRTPDNDIRRELSPYEKRFGVDYNPLTEELIVEEDMDGNRYEYVQKFKEGTKLLNHRDAMFTARSVISSTREMAAQIKSLMANDMEHDRRIYDQNTQEIYDYWRALVMERYDIQNQELRDNLAVLFSWEYIPIKENIGDKNVREDIIRDRTEYFGAGTIHSDWASIGEMIIYYAKQLDFSTGKAGTTEQFADMMVETLGLDLEYDEDPVINDTILSFVESHRLGKANIDGTYGLFHISEEAYKESQSLWHEHNHLISDIVDGRYMPEFRIEYTKESENWLGE
nr:MAG TPA: ATPase [Caudoviricetes sp.]